MPPAAEPVVLSREEADRVAGVMPRRTPVAKPALKHVAAAAGADDVDIVGRHPGQNRPCGGRRRPRPRRVITQQVTPRLWKKSEIASEAGQRPGLLDREG